MTLIETIKKYARLRGMSLKDVALKSGLSENAIYNWKSHTPSDPTLNAVAKTLGISYEELTGTAKTKEPTKIDIAAALDDEDTVIMTYQGKPIDEEDMELIKRILKGR